MGRTWSGWRAQPSLGLPCLLPHNHHPHPHPKEPVQTGPPEHRAASPAEQPDCASSPPILCQADFCSADPGSEAHRPRILLRLPCSHPTRRITIGYRSEPPISSAEPSGQRPVPNQNEASIHICQIKSRGCRGTTLSFCGRRVQPGGPLPTVRPTRSLRRQVPFAIQVGDMN